MKKDVLNRAVTKGFYARISKLLKRIDALISRAKECAKTARVVNRLSSQLDRKQDKYNALVGRPILPLQSKTAHRRTARILACKSQINSLERQIDDAYKTLISASENVRKFVAAVQDALGYAPANSLCLQSIRAEIERLQLLAVVRAQGPLPMKLVHPDLQKLKERLSEFLEPYPELLPAGPRAVREKIVNQLQTKLGCHGREALARNLRTSDTAIRAAIRRATTHSGPAAEKKILEACREKDVDATNWGS